MLEQRNQFYLLFINVFGLFFRMEIGIKKIIIMEIKCTGWYFDSSFHMVSPFLFPRTDSTLNVFFIIYKFVLKKKYTYFQDKVEEIVFRRKFLQNMFFKIKFC